MCGIVGAILPEGARRFLLHGLATLEYRGYDSAGVAFSGNEICRIVTTSRVGKLKQLIKDQDGKAGIGHTRWATHGAANEQNAHPVMSGQVAVVHNGIIENHAELRSELSKSGREFHTETDTEVIAHLLDLEIARNKDLLAAMQAAASRLQGAFALAALTAKRDDIVFARHGAPLMIGEDANGIAYLASDAQALEHTAGRAAYLEDGDCGILSADGVQIVNDQGQPVERTFHPIPTGMSVASLGEHRHFMQKEIFEQPVAVAAAARSYIQKEQISLRKFGTGASEVFRKAKNITIIGCGTSYHAAMIATYYLRKLGLPCRAAIASEYRYCQDRQAEGALAVVISQSGETADTLSAMRAAKQSGATTLALVNSPMSAMSREADFVMPTCAGPEIGVASTKCFTAQLAQLLILSLALAKAQKQLSDEDEAQAVSQLRNLPNMMRRALLLEKDIRKWAHNFAVAKSALYIGRGPHYPLALEGALKLKEISYLHAEGCPAGELKHGMLALVDDSIPVVGLAPSGPLSSKTASNLAEVAARNGPLYVLSGGGEFPSGAHIIAVEDGGEWISPMVYSVPLQLLAYHVALEKGTDIDKPRNLAKSVTVE